jgi:hypothetical protein
MRRLHVAHPFIHPDRKCNMEPLGLPRDEINLIEEIENPVPVAILLTWRNMLPNVLATLVQRLAGKYGRGYTEIFFDDQNFRDQLAAAVPDDIAIPLKIYISGHGNVGVDHITDDSQTRQKTVQQLASLLTDALEWRATERAQSGATQINMISCLFARTPDGSAYTSPAAKLHAALARSGIFVDLVGRTESIVAMNDGRRTISLLNHKVYEPAYGRLEQFYQNKAPYSKILHTFHGPYQVVRLAPYNGNEAYIEHDSARGRRILWADHAINQLVGRMRLDQNNEVVGARQQKLKNIVTWYDNLRDPQGLRARLAALVDGSGDTIEDNFLIHRNFFHNPFSVPETARFIRRLLQSYPE